MSSKRPTSFLEGVSEIDDSPDVRHATLWGDVWKRLQHDKRFWIAAVLIVMFALMAIVPQLFLTKNPQQCPLSDSALRPSSQHWFGTDILGCDYYTRAIYGARTSMEVGVIVATLTIFISLVLGAAAGYYGGKTDMIISRIADIMFSVPTILGAILVLTLFHANGPVPIALVIVFFGWPDMTRLVRSTVISGKSRGYVRAAKTMGSSGRTILRRHVLPNGIAPVLVFAAYVASGAIGAEAALTYLGVGLQLPAISWGLQLAVADTRFPQDAYLMFFPSLFLCLILGAFILLGESLRDALDVKLVPND